MLFANLCVHTHTHRLTVRMPLLIPNMATRKGMRRNNDRNMRHPLLFIVACSFALSLPVLSLLHLFFSCLIILFPFHFIMFPFLFYLSVSFPLPSPFCCHVSFLAILSFSFSSAWCFPFTFFYHFILLLFRRSCPFLLFACSVGSRLAACKGWAQMLFANLCVHTHTHRLTVRMPLLIPKMATRKGMRRNNDSKMRHPILSIVAFPFALPLPFLVLLLLFFSCLIILFPVHFFSVSFLLLLVCFLSPSFCFLLPCLVLSHLSLFLFLVLSFRLSILWVCSLQRAKAGHICHVLCKPMRAYKHTLTDGQLECPS